MKRLDKLAQWDPGWDLHSDISYCDFFSPMNHSNLDVPLLGWTRWVWPAEEVEEREDMLRVPTAHFRDGLMC